MGVKSTTSISREVAEQMVMEIVPRLLQLDDDTLAKVLMHLNDACSLDGEGYINYFIEDDNP